MDQQSGILTVQKSLDYELKKEFSLLIEARDSGFPPFSSFEEIHINITDVNDNAPLFSQMVYRCEVFENSPPTFVCDVLAIDADSGMFGIVQYNITEGNSGYVFMIDPESGVLTTTVSLDREYNSVFNLTIEAAEWYNPHNMDRATVIIAVLDRNDNAPQFSHIFIAEVSEDSPIGHTVLHITSTDDDAEANLETTYSIIDRSNHLPFAIDVFTGYITVTDYLDREVLDLYNIKVSANDSVWSASTDITIFITDVNDNRPVFSDSLYAATLQENLNNGVFVAQVHATDADIGLNSKILYVIEPPSDDYGQIVYSVAAGQVDKFAIDSRNGTITTLDVFDYEQHRTSFDLTIKAVNLGGHPLFSLAQVLIQIVDTDEYIPRFKEKEFYFSISKSVPAGTRIGKVEAVDQDLGPEGTVFYLMFGQNKYLGFDVHRTSGEIYTTGSLRKQGNTNIVLKVMAKNAGVITGEEVDEALVIVSVINTNDAPSFAFLEYFVNVTEDSPVGSYVTAVTALDQDSFLNNLFYSIQDGNTHFSFAVNPSNGIILVNTPLDREQWPLYNLTVTATDFGFPRATGTTNVIVIIGDVNDNAPLLTVTEAQIKENLPQGSLVGKLNAIDSDLTSPRQGRV
uniref:Cadherin domain-containing protein n=1 Tax=Neogobius melanostomus TaxID=47308 RepID=A0A8C6TAA4_9GOBI